MADFYESFDDLLLNEKINEDYRINYRCEEVSDILVIAPHGGGIEEGTSEICLEIAKDKYNYYIFEGIKLGGNSKLHISSNKYTEITLNEMLKELNFAISLHGCKEKSEAIFVGGRFKTNEIIEAFRASGYNALPAPPSLAGTNLKNLVNRTKSGEGIQLELSAGLRETFFEDVWKRKGRINKTAEFYRFCECVQNIIGEFFGNIISKKIDI